MDLLRRTTRAFLPVVGPLFWLVGCREITAPSWPTEGYLAVYGVLLAGSDTASLILQRGIGGGGTYFQAVEDAETILDEGGVRTVLERQRPDFPSCRRPPTYELGSPTAERDCWTAQLPHGIAPGEQYHLRSELGSGELILGSVQIPGWPTILAPENGQRWTVPFRIEPAGSPLMTVPLRWRPGSRSARVEIHGALAKVWRGTSDVALEDCETQVYAPPSIEVDPGDQTTDLWFYGALCESDEGTIPWDSLDLRLTVVGYEENYASYAEGMIGGREVARDAAGPGLEGAIGVFGGAAIRWTSIRIVLDEVQNGSGP
jgi:hypothetical protein